jgi:hypothetical protein
MKRLLLPFAAAAALAVPTVAGAHGWHHHHALAKLSGTGTSFANASATATGTFASDRLGNGTFGATVTTDWSKATTRTLTGGTLSCAPSSTALTLTGSAKTVTGTLTGRTCTFTKSDGTVLRGVMGRSDTLKLFLVQKSDGSVRGAVFSRRSEGAQFSFLAFTGEHHCSH